MKTLKKQENFHLFLHLSFHLIFSFSLLLLSGIFVSFSSFYFWALSHFFFSLSVFFFFVNPFFIFNFTWEKELGFTYWHILQNILVAPLFPHINIPHNHNAKDQKN